MTEFEGNLAKTISYPGGVKRTYEYDGLARTSQILVEDNADNTKMNYRYKFDSVGNIKEKATSQGVFKYDYDKADRLTSAEQPNVFGNKTFVYDENSNRTRLVGKEGTFSYSYNDNQELTNIELDDSQSAVNQAFNYDNNGAPSSETSDSLSRVNNYNAYGRLASVVDNEVEIAEYQYDVQQRRISKNVNGETTYFLYDDSGAGLVGEYSSDGELIRGYVYNPTGAFTSNPISQKSKVETSDGSVEFINSFYQNDHLGSPQQLLDTNGAVVWNGEQDVFGEVRPTINTVTSPIRFPGQYFDDETNNHQNWNRYYNPQQGRYSRRDPIGLAGGTNTYGYVSGNPLAFSDPTGLRGFIKEPMTPATKPFFDCKTRATIQSGGVEGVPGEFPFAYDHLIHCFVMCKIVAECGAPPFVGRVGGVIKEIKDAFSPRSSEFRDLLNNEGGIGCAVSGQQGCKGCNNELPVAPGECTDCCKCKDRLGLLYPRGNITAGPAMRYF